MEFALGEDHVKSGRFAYRSKLQTSLVRLLLKHAITMGKGIHTRLLSAVAGESICNEASWLNEVYARFTLGFSYILPFLIMAGSTCLVRFEDYKSGILAWARSRFGDHASRL